MVVHLGHGFDRLVLSYIFLLLLEVGGRLDGLSSRDGLSSLVIL